MSDQQEKPSEVFDVAELDDKDLGDVAGGYREAGGNNYNCGCGGYDPPGSSDNTNCGCPGTTSEA